MICFIVALVAGAALCWAGIYLTRATNWGARVLGAAFFIWGVLLITLSLKNLIQ